VLLLVRVQWWSALVSRLQELSTPERSTALMEWCVDYAPL
jgi:hypothetical protein